MKKIILVESRYNSFYGAQKSMLKLIDILKNQYECTVITTKEGELSRNLRDNGVKVKVIPLGEKANALGGKVLSYGILSKIIVLFQILLLNLRILKFIKEEKIDLVYVNDQRALIYCFFSAKLLNKKIIYYIRSELTYSNLTKLSFKYSDQIITIANGVLRNLPDSFIGKYNKKIINIYTGFDFSNARLLNKNWCKVEWGFDENDTIVGFVGSLNSRKGIDILIDSLLKLNKRSINLLLVGDVSDGYQDYWNQMLEELKRSDINFRYAGYQSDMNKVYSSIDILVLPSRGEGLPRTVLEAMSYKSVVIATDVGGTREIIDNPDLGRIIPKENSDELSKALDELLGSEQVRLEIGEHARKHVLSKFNSQQFEDRILELFNRVLTK
jgi:L-malate glycosyltransferase